MSTISTIAKNEGDLSPSATKMMQTYLYMKDKYGEDHPTVLRLATQLGLLEHTAHSSRINDEPTRTIVTEGLRKTISSQSQDTEDQDHDDDDLDDISMTGTDNVEEESEEEESVVEETRTRTIDTKNDKANSILDGFLASRVTKVADAKREGDETKLKLYTRELKDATTAIETLAEEAETGEVSIDSTNTSLGSSETQDDDDPDETMSAVLPFALTSGTLLVLICVLIMNGTCACQTKDEKNDDGDDSTPGSSSNA